MHVQNRTLCKFSILLEVNIKSLFLHSAKFDHLDWNSENSILPDLFFLEISWLYLYLSISTASPPLGDYVQVRVSAVLVEEMLLKIKSSHKIC